MGGKAIHKQELKDVLRELSDGKMSVEEAIEKLRYLPYEDLKFACLDHHRTLRCGFCEVIYCPHKSVEQIVEIFGKLAEQGNNVLATRAERQVYEALLAAKGFEKAEYNELAKAIVLKQKKVRPSKSVLPIVTAGTADIPVAAEAKVTAEILGQRTELVCDVGVAGLHRLVEHLPKLQKANVIIVVAGMDGALASVVGGMVDCPVIAVPTSVGYGAGLGGIAACLTMLNSCAAGVTVVNIDNGFGAAVTATLINRKIEKAGKCK